ncbi:50S ribosomal protein L7/L12 [Blattabacterium cuenoti]|uniref:50S ribosomal protein L7/L12 n=1 Tax=Blattabacterium cuenoti TaxID=1653831 RepID=UPI00163BB7D7|nr:50S ribosomal protein L7/L12 [Blattabacterium cuenoti]
MIEKLAEQLVSLTVKEVSELIIILKEKYGINPKNVEKLDNHSDKLNESSKEVTKSVFNITLTSVGSSKLSIVKLIKEITGKGLKESKDLADNVPSIIKESVNKKEANNMKNRFEELGAKVELK